MRRGYKSVPISVQLNMNRLIGRDGSKRGRYALLANDWNNNSNNDDEGGGGVGDSVDGNPRPDKRYITLLKSD